MKIKIFFSVLTFVIGITLNGQEIIIHEEGIIVDQRDGKTYQTILIDSILWISENMKYKTEKSDSIVFSKLRNSLSI